MHIGCKGAELERWWACIKSRQWKASVQNQNRDYLHHLSPEHWAVTFPPIYLISDNFSTFHIIRGVKIHVTILGTCLANNDFSLAILHLQKPRTWHCMLHPMTQKDLWGWQWLSASSPSHSSSTQSGQVQQGSVFDNGKIIIGRSKRRIAQKAFKTQGITPDSENAGGTRNGPTLKNTT